MMIISIVMFVAVVHCTSAVPIVEPLPIEERILDPYRIEPRLNLRRIRIENEPLGLWPAWDFEMRRAYFNRIDRINLWERFINDMERPEVFLPSRRINRVERPRPIDWPVVGPVVDRVWPEILPFTPRIEDVDPVLWNREMMPPFVEPIQRY